MQHCLRVFDIINTPYHHPEFNYGYHIVIVSPPATPFHIRIESNQCILLSLEREVQNSFSSRSDGFISLWISRFQSECHPLFPHFYHSYQVLKSVLNSTRNEYHNHGNYLSTNIILDSLQTVVFGLYYHLDFSSTLLHNTHNRHILLQNPWKQ